MTISKIKKRDLFQLEAAQKLENNPIEENKSGSEKKSEEHHPKKENGPPNNREKPPSIDQNLEPSEKHKSEKHKDHPSSEPEKHHSKNPQQNPTQPNENPHENPQNQNKQHKDRPDRKQHDSENQEQKNPEQKKSDQKQSDQKQPDQKQSDHKQPDQTSSGQEPNEPDQKSSGEPDQHHSLKEHSGKKNQEQRQKAQPVEKEKSGGLDNPTANKQNPEPVFQAQGEDQKKSIDTLQTLSDISKASSSYIASSDTSSTLSQLNYFPEDQQTQTILSEVKPEETNLPATASDFRGLGIAANQYQDEFKGLGLIGVFGESPIQSIGSSSSVNDRLNLTTIILLICWFYFMRYRI